MSSPVRIPASALRSTLSPEQWKALALPEAGELDVRRTPAGEWIVSLPAGSVVPPLHQKVLRLIQTHQTHELIEGRFEQLLSGEELNAFEELKKQGKVHVYKSSPKFDKGIYRITKQGTSPPVAPTVTPPVSERSMDEYSLVGDGFQVLRTEGAAKAASFDLAERIRSGEVKGIKSFDGFYYLIENELLQKHMSRIVGLIESEKKIDLSVLSAQLTIPVVLSRIVLEFAKEEGSIIEKKKNVFAYVG